MAEVHEASERLGGRVWTIRDYFAEGQIAEHGGELIDSDHTAVRGLVDELGLKLDNVIAAQKPGTREHPLHRRRPVSTRPGAGRLRGGPAGASPRPGGGRLPDLPRPPHRGRGRARPNVDRGVDRAQRPGGIGLSVRAPPRRSRTRSSSGPNAPIRARSTSSTSSATPSPIACQLFGSSNERFHVQGGNDLMISGLAERLRGQIQRGSRLVAMRRASSGGYSLTLRPRRRGGRRPSGPTRWCSRSLSPCSAARSTTRGRLQPAEADGDRRARDGHRTRSSSCSSPTDTGGLSAPTAAPTPTRGYQSTWEVTRAQPGRAGHPRRLHRRRTRARRADAGSVRSARPALPGPDPARDRGPRTRSGTAA